MLNLKRVATSRTLGQPYQIIRTAGHFGAGGWIQDTTATINVFGVVSAGSEQDLEQVPEGDRVKGGKFFYAAVPMYETRAESPSGISDKIVFGGDTFRVSKVLLDGDAGCWKVYAVRMSGD